jgi:MEDS: MEthanogen/methylotroph, DcmR Sensory domain
MTTATAEPIAFAGGTLTQHRHVCAFFATRDEEYRVLMPFVAEGIRRGDNAYHIVDPALRSDHRRRLAEAGINVPGAEKTGQLQIKEWQDAYLREGHFDQERMLALIEEVLESGHARGTGLTRLVAHMEWALTDFPGVSDLVRYETRLNYLLPKYRDPVI